MHRRPSSLEARLLHALTLLGLVACGQPPSPEPDTGAGGPEARTPAALEASLGCVDPPGTPPPEGALVRMRVLNASARSAVCNDGTTPSYYVRRGVGCGARRWVIHLQGGGACYQPGCLGRDVKWMSSNDDPPTLTQVGILSTQSSENPDFFTANHVYLSYCSSDAYSGDRAASAETGGIHFRGSRIVTAVLEDLANPEVTPGLNLAQATEILLTGSSAGGFGVFFNLDRVGAAFPTKRVRGLSDAGWEVDTAAYDPARPSTVDQAAATRELWGSVGDASCAAAETEQPGRCGVGQWLYPYLSTPVFVHQDQFDPSKLGGLGLTEPIDSSELAFAQAYAAKVRDTLVPVDGVFSPKDRVHTILLGPGFSTPTVAGFSLRQTFGNWYFERSGPMRLVE
jgi:hypothetical protein